MDDEGEPQGGIKISEEEGSSTKSSQSIEQMVKDMLVDDSFLKDIKTNSLICTLVMNCLQDILKETEQAALEQANVNMSSQAPSGSPKPGNVWNQFDVSKLKTPNKKLKYFALKVKDEETYVRMSVPEVHKEIEYWSNTVVVYVLGAYPPFHVMNGYLHRIWKEYEIDKILQVQRGVFLVRFGAATNREIVIQRGTPTFDRKLVVATPWPEDMELKTDIHQIFVWVQFPSLPLKFWGAENLCRLAIQVGVLVDIDELTILKNRGQFARVQVMVEIKEEVVESVKYIDENGRLCEQQVHYEWLPVIYKKCKA